jgi:hypothetical protein
MRVRFGTSAFARVAVGVAVAATLAGVAAARGPVSRREAETFQRKVAEIQRHGAGARQGVRVTPVYEGEVNSFLHFEGAAALPPGVREPSVAIPGNSRVTGRAVVDLDAVRASRPRGILDPMNLLSGQLEVTASGTLAAIDGRARFTLESATVGGVPVPGVLLEELVSYYTRSPEWPAGLDLDDTFALPARIRQIDLRPGEAIVVQR